jgi:hypothetical protein
MSHLKSIQKIGRPRVEEALVQAGGVVAHAARTLGVNRRTISRWMQKDPALRELVEEQRELLVDEAENVIAQAVNAGDVKAAQFVLSRLGKNRGWSERREISCAHLHVRTVVELPNDVLERAIMERLGVETLPEDPRELSKTLARLS